MNLEYVKMYNYKSFQEQLDYIVMQTHYKLLMNNCYSLKCKEVYNVTRHLLLITSIVSGLCIQAVLRTQAALLLIS